MRRSWIYSGLGSFLVTLTLLLTIFFPVFDPKNSFASASTGTFGNTSSGSSGTSIEGQAVARACLLNTGDSSSYTLDSIVAYVAESGLGSYDGTVTAAIFEYVDHEIDWAGVKYDEESNTSVSCEGSKWITVSFATPYTMTGNTWYYLVLYATADTQSTFLLEYSDSINGLGWYDNDDAPTFSSPYADEDTSDLKNYSIYGVYTSASNNNPVQSSMCAWDNIQPSNISLNTTKGVAIPPTSFNITVSDVDSSPLNITMKENTTVPGTWRIFNTTSSHTTGVYRGKNTSWVTSWNKKYWVSVNVTDGEGGEKNITYYFTTRAAPTVWIVNPVNSSTGVSVPPIINITVNTTTTYKTDVYFLSNVTGTWVQYQKNASVNSNGTVRWSFTQASNKGIRYWWRVNRTQKSDGSPNASSWYVFNNASGDPIITAINFAGNHSDEGGPYWRPPSESTALSGVNLDGYYTNASHQRENWIYINISTYYDDCSHIWLNWLNKSASASTWTNYTYEFTQKNGNYAEFNTSGVVPVKAGYNYSFNVVANNSLGDDTEEWNKKVIGGGSARRFVQLNSSPINISYTPLYFQGGVAIVTADQWTRDRLTHDQGVDGGYHDTGYLSRTALTDTIMYTNCTTFVGYWYDDSSCVSPFTLKNIYYHFWWSNNDGNLSGMAGKGINWDKGREDVSGSSPINWSNTTTASERSNIFVETPLMNDAFFNENYSLSTCLLDTTDTVFTDNNIYELSVIFSSKVTMYPSVISNRSFESFVLFNVPDNATLDASHNDTDSDGLCDRQELYLYYTNPFLSDTDDDGVSDYNESLSGSDPNNYTDTIEWDSTSPTITINFAGNHSDKGGPWWKPPTESVSISTINGYYNNDSRQQEDWVYINLTVTDGTAVDDVYLHWHNDTTDTWTNNTYKFVKKNTDYYEINTSINITNITAEDKYSFDVWANDTNNNIKITYWNKTGLSGNIVRRYVQLGCTPENISYDPYYFYVAEYSASDLSKRDRLHHDQGPDGGVTDTGYLYQDLPTNTTTERSCTSYVGYWFDENISVEPLTIKNIYYHFWWSDADSVVRTGWQANMKREVTSSATDSLLFDAEDLNRSQIYYADGDYEYKNYTLSTFLLDTTDTVVTDNSMYNINVLFNVETSNSISVINNRSYTSFVLFNVPDNTTLDASFNDSDSDGLCDRQELYKYYTSPFLVDTDADGVNDYNETLSGSDPNNYTDILEYNITWHEINNTINGSVYNTTNWILINNSFNGTFYNLSTWNIINNSINGTFYNVSIYEWTVIDSTINGSVYNTTHWIILDSIINGSICNTSTDEWTVINNTINGSIYNTTTWYTINNTINGTIYNTTATWTAFDDLLNGSIWNQTTTWTTLSNTINGSLFNTSTWATIDNTINGTIYNTSTTDTSVDLITPYITTTSPKTITATGDSGLTNVSLFYRWSLDNNTWGGIMNWHNDSVDKNDTDVDGISDMGINHSFVNCKETAPDTDTMTLQELISYETGYEIETVSSKSTTYNQWVHVGTTPYLNTDNYPTSYIYVTARNYNDGWYSISDPSTIPAEESILCTMYFNAWRGSTGGADDYADVYVDYTGGTGTDMGNICTSTSSSAVQSINVGVLTLTQVNNLRFYVRSTRVGAQMAPLYIDYVYVNFTYPGVQPTTSYQLNQEFQWNNVDYNQTNETLCIYIAGHTGSETLDVNYWTGSYWSTLGEITSTGWTNLTATGLTESDYTIQLVDDLIVDDASQDTWTVDCMFLQTYDYLINGSAWSLFSIDDTNPWSWSFTFPESYGYYEFYSIGQLTGEESESAPASADEDTYYTTYTAPTITSPFPANNSKHVLTGIANLSAIIDSDGVWNISLYDNDTRTLQAYSSGSSSTGLQTCSVIDVLYYMFDKNYTWFVNTTSNGVDWVNNTYYFTTFNGSGFLFLQNLTNSSDYNISSGVWVDYPYVYFLTNYSKIISLNKYRIENLSLVFVDNVSFTDVYTQYKAIGVAGNNYVYMFFSYFNSIYTEYQLRAYNKSTLSFIDFTLLAGSDIDIISNGTSDRIHVASDVDINPYILCKNFNGATFVTEDYIQHRNKKVSVFGNYIVTINYTTSDLYLYDFNETTPYEYAFLDTYAGTYNDVTNDGNYFYAVSDTSMDILSVNDADELVLEYSYVDSGMSVCSVGDKSFIGSLDGNLLSYMFEGGNFIEQDTINMINNTGSIYELDGTTHIYEYGCYLVVAGEEGGLHLYGYELLHVAPPVIDLAYAGNPGKDVVTRDGTIRYVNQSYNNETFCNITASITIPDYRTIGRYFRSTDDNIFIPSGNLTDNDNKYVNERNQSIIASKYRCTFTGDYSKISAYIVGSGMSQPWTAFAIYSDNAGVPGSPLGYTDRDYPGSDVFTDLQRDLGALYYPPSTRIWQTQNIAYDSNGHSATSVSLTEGLDYWLVFATNDSYGYKTYGYTYSNDIYWLIGNSLGDTCYVKMAPFNLEDDMNFSNATGLSWSDALGMNGEEVHYACIYAIANSTYNNDIEPVDVSSAVLHWYNDSVNTWNMSMTQIGATGNWTKNVTGLTPGHWYTFDIVAFDELNDDVTYEHYRYIVEGDTERIEFQCGVPYVDAAAHQGYNSTSTLYRNESVLYLWNRTYGTDTWYGDDEQMEDALPHEQGVDGTADDTGGWETTLPDDLIQARHCLKFAGAWWDDNITIQDTVTLNNVYVHLWGGGGTKYDKMRLHYGQLDTLYNFQWLDITSTRGVEYNYTELQTNASTRESAVVTAAPETCSDPSGVDDTFRLICEHINLSNQIADVTFDSGSIYNFFLGYDNNGTLAWTKESAMIINNRSYLSFVIFNIPPDIYDGTDTTTDSDSDSLSDYYEMNVSFTHPFLMDTDADGVNDNTDDFPNDYTKFYFTWNVIDSAINGTIHNTSTWNIINDTINGTVYNTTHWTGLDTTINGTIYNNTGAWNTISSDINGYIYNISTWNIIDSTINGTIHNTSTWNIFNDTINGTVYNATITWKTTDLTINGTIYNLSSWLIFNNTINGTLFNSTTWTTINNTINGTLYNTSAWNIINNTINGSIYNITHWTIINNTINGTIYNTSSWNIINNTINGAIYNTTHWTGVDTTLNGTICNNTGTWNIVDNSFNGTVYNTSYWNVIDSTVNGSFYNTTNWQAFNTSINGTLYNTSTWNIIDDTINGTFYNTTHWTGVDTTINGSVYNTSSWNVLNNTINGSMYNISSWHINDNTINGTIYNITTYGWGPVNTTINGSIYNQTSSWTTLASDMNGSVYNTTNWIVINNSINGSIYNLSTTWSIIDADVNGTIYNSTLWFDVDASLNGSIFNLSASWNILDTTVNGSLYNITNWITINNTINGTIYNISTDEWNVIDNTINGTIYNTTTWDILDSTINGTIYNISSWYTIDVSINGTIYNTTNWTTLTNTINGTIYNTTVGVIFITNEDPANTSIDITLQYTCAVKINDSNGDIMTLAWYENTTGTWKLQQTNHSCVNGTYRWIYTNASSYSTIYWWRVYVNDSSNNSGEWYYYSTLHEWIIINNAINGTIRNITSGVLIINIYPINESTITNIQPTVYFTLYNSTGAANYTVYTGNSSINATAYLFSANGVGNITAHSVYFNASSYYVPMYWKVCVVDCGIWTNETYWFTIMHEGGGISTGGTAIGVIGIFGLIGVVGFFIHRKRKKR